MDNLILSINVVMPLFIQIILGMILGRTGILEADLNKKLNSLVFKVFLPILLFWNIYSADLGEVVNPRLMGLTAATLVIYCVFLCVIVPLFEKDNKKRGVIIQAGCRSNFVLFGMPLALLIVGQENIGPTALLVAVVVPAVNILSVIVLELFRGESIKLGAVLKGIAKNPLVRAAVIAIILQLIGLKMPQFLTKSISTISGVATPLALIVLGAEIRFEDARVYIKQLFAGLGFKLVLEPLLFIPIAVWMGFRGPELVPFIIMCASPTAVSSYTMAEQMGADGKLASQLVFYSTAFSVVTIFTTIFITKSLGLF